MSAFVGLGAFVCCSRRNSVTSFIRDNKKAIVTFEFTLAVTAFVIAILALSTTSTGLSQAAGWGMLTGGIVLSTSIILLLKKFHPKKAQRIQQKRFEREIVSNY